MNTKVQMTQDEMDDFSHKIAVYEKKMEDAEKFGKLVEIIGEKSIKMLLDGEAQAWIQIKLSNNTGMGEK